MAAEFERVRWSEKGGSLSCDMLAMILIGFSWAFSERLEIESELISFEVKGRSFKEVKLRGLDFREEAGRIGKVWEK